jgi:thioredoxin 1
LKSSKVFWLGIIPALTLFSAAVLFGIAANTLPGQSMTPIRATKGEVLVTNRLDVDFAAYKVTFIEIGADRCIPCRKMQPIMKDVAAEFAEDVQVVFYDVWKDPEPGRKYGIQLIPTQVFLDAEGKEFYRHVGLFPKDELVAVLFKQGAKK